jgi:ABC-type multidrug transport system fused ATPase/permease subunit
VNLDEVDVSTLNVEALRSQMAIVSQEPAVKISLLTLFSKDL